MTQRTRLVCSGITNPNQRRVVIAKRGGGKSASGVTGFTWQKQIKRRVFNDLREYERNASGTDHMLY